MTEKTKKKQITATVCLSKEDKQTIVEHAKAKSTSLSALMVEASLKACNEGDFKQLIVDITKPTSYITMPTWMTSEDLKTAAKMLALMEGPTLPEKEE